MHDAGFIADLAMVMGVAAVTALLAHRLGQPSILGYLFAGLVVGPYLPVPIFADPHRVETMAEFGVVLVMFAVGLEFRLATLLRLLPTSGFTGLVQVSSLIALGVATAHLLGWSPVEAAFLGASIAISSTMVVSKVFGQAPVDSATRGLVLGVLVFQDVVAIALITAMTAIAAGAGLSAASLGATLGRLGGALLAMLTLGMLVVPRLVRWVLKLGSPELSSVVTIGLCFALALLAEVLGYSVALGAFVAGVLVAESGESETIEPLVQPMRDVFAAVFFVSIGMTVDPLEAYAQLPTSLLVAAVVVLGQLVSVCIAALLSGNGPRRSLTAGLALGQVGEFSFILATIGVGAGVVRDALSTVLVTVAVLTAFTTPWLLRRAERLVGLLDRHLPARLQHLLGLYEEWFERLRQAPDWSAGNPARRALRAIAIDTVALVGMLALATLWFDALTAPLEALLPVTPALARALCGALLALLSVPFLFGLVRATRALSAAVIDAVAGTVTGAEGRARRIGMRALDTSVRVLVLGGVGVPLGAAMTFFVGDVAAFVWLTCLLLGGAVHVWRSATEVDVEFQSGAEEIARSLSTQPPRHGETLSSPTLMPGLDEVTTLALSVNDAAIGLTLAQLDVRARTGATVVAIRHLGSRVILPTGHEQLGEGDVLAVTGTPEALTEARRLFEQGPRAEVAIATPSPGG